MANSALIQVRIDEETKQKADSLFADLGFDTPTAIRIFLNQSIRREGMPFEVAKPVPNARTLVTLLNNMDIVPKTYDSFREILEEVDAEIAEEECYED